MEFLAAFTLTFTALFVALDVIGWQQWFAQTIDAYRSVDFAALRNREDNDDRTQGGRLTLSHRAGPATLRWSASAQTSRHIQTDTAFPPGVDGTELGFRQSLLAIGVEADVPLGAATALTAGLGYDSSANPETGNKPAQPAKAALAFSAGLRHDFSDTLTLTLSGGRRTRFPSARELFGEALGRFLPNPALEPETVWLGDAELTWQHDGVTVTINPFVMRTRDSISQRVVRVGPQSVRQRFNLRGATAFGVDALLLVPIGGDWTVELTGTALNARADAGDAPFRRQIQRPEHEAMLAVDWAPAGFDMRAELRRTGSAVDLAPDGTKAVLAAATEINLRAALPIMRFADGGHLSFTAAADNLTNAVIAPQLGLPQPGRALRFGFRLN